ncbi:OmpL47-type beta-barrel domain-containing protein [Paenibacillus terreus]|uniref:OmpL47-type beta-barrel domain-containing protein n=1 Tax=Paenibacillus terreus TaxID=1387834 RepID=UPI0035CD23F0
MRRCVSILLLIILVSGIFNPYFGSTVYGSIDMPEAANQSKNAELPIRNYSDSLSDPDKQAADPEREEAVQNNEYSDNNEINTFNNDAIVPDMPNILVNNVSWDSDEKQLAIQDGVDAGGSGVLKSQYKIGDGEWQDYRLPVRIQDQDTVIYARTLDRAGNISAIAQSSTRISKTRPATPSIQLSSSEYTEHPVTVTITGSRAETMKTQYKLGEFGSWIDYTEPFTITKEGRTTVYARTVGISMIVSNIASADAKIQTTPSAGPVMHTAAEWEAIANANQTKSGISFMQRMRGFVLSAVHKLANHDGQLLLIDVIAVLPSKERRVSRKVLLAKSAQQRKQGSRASDRGFKNRTYRFSLWKRGAALLLCIALQFSVFSNYAPKADAAAHLYNYSKYEAVATPYGPWTDHFDGVVGGDRYNNWTYPGTGVRGWTTSLHVRVVMYQSARFDSATGEYTLYGSRNTMTIETANTNAYDKDIRDYPYVYSISYESKYNPGVWVPVTMPKNTLRIAWSASFDQSESEAGFGYYDHVATPSGYNYTPGELVGGEQAPDGTYPDNGRAADGYFYVKGSVVNAAPSVAISTAGTRYVSLASGYNAITISGTATDMDGDTLTITGNLGGVTKSTTVPPGAWSLTWSGAELTEGPKSMSVSVNDGYGGTASAGYSGSIIVDKTAPGAPTLLINNPAYSNVDKVVTIQHGADSGGSGVLKSQYRIGANGAWTDYVSAINVTQEGVNIYARTVDNAGNIGPISELDTKIDKTVPTAPTITTDKAGKSNTNVTVTITPGTDAKSGVARTEYALSGATVSDWKTYSASFQVTNEGKTTISARTVDNAGNFSSTKTTVVHIDKTGPARPTIVPSKTLSNAEVPVEIVPAADSDLSGTEYKLDGAVTQNWQSYSGRFSIPAVEGETTITARSFDDVGNQSAISTSAVQIDTTKPTSPVIALDPIGKAASDVTVSITPGTDAFSGVEKTEYALSGAENADWKEVKNPFTIVTEGETVVRARTIDKAGNISEVSEETVRIDRTSPGVPEIRPSKAVSNRDIRVTIEPSADQDVSLTEYKLEGAINQGWQPYGSEFVIPAVVEGETVITARSTDDVGNVGEETNVTVLIDTTSPTVPVIEVSKASPSKEDVSVHIRPGTDTGSGIHRTEYILSGATQFKWPVDAEDDFIVSAEGTTVITARSYDQAGNVSEEAIYELMIDKSKPLVTVTADAEYAQDAIHAVFKFEDAISGIEKRYIQVSDSPDAPQTWIPADSDTETTITDEGIWYVHAKAIDKAGNVADADPLRIVVDRTAPSAPVITTTEDDYTAGNVDFMVDGSTDLLSPFYYEYQIGNGAFEKGSSGSISENGTTVISARAIDAAGNVSAITSKTVYIDKQGPAIDIDPDGRGWSDDDIHASVSFSDEGSGVKERYYKITNSSDAPATWDIAADNRVELTIKDEGIWYIHAKAVDQVGNDEIIVSKPFHLQEEPEAPSLSVQSVKQDEAVLEWSLPNGAAYTDGYKYTLYNRSTGQHFTADFPENVLTVTGLQPGTRYPFELEVSNHVGKATSSTVEVLTLPAAPQHMIVSPVEYDSSQVLVTADPVQSATAYRLRAVQVDTMQEVFNETVTTSVYAPVLNLQPATFYDISISAINESGEGPATHQSIMSLPASPGFTYVRVGERDIDLQWDSVTSATYYELERDGITVYDDVYNAFHDVGLNSGTEYSYRLTATNESGSGDEARLDLITLPAKAENFRSLDAGVDWIRLGWRPVRGAAGYWFSIDGGPPMQLGADQKEITIRDLPSGQSAQFTIQPYNRSGLGVMDATYALTVPQQVDGIRFTDIGEKSVKVNWNTVPGATKYQVSMNGQRMTVSDNFAVFTGLEGGTSYEASVASGNASGFGEKLSASVLTLPAAPQGLNGIHTKDTSFTLTWTPSKSATLYRVEQEGSGELGIATSPAMNISGLLPGVLYHFRVFAVNENGEGNYSRFTWRTLPSDMKEGFIQVSDITPSSAQATWKEVTGADFYRVYLDGQIIGETASLAYSLSALNSSQTYVIGVEPVNTSGGGMELTAAFETLPAGDFTLSSEHTTDSVTLFIEGVQPNDIVIISLAGKEVYRGKANQFTKNELAPGTSYTFTVWTENTGGRKSAPKELTVRTDTKPSVGTGGGGGGGGGQTTVIESPAAPIEEPVKPEIPREEANSGENNEGKGFVDIDKTFSREKITYLAGKGIVEGTTETTFEPNRAVTRAEYMAMMVRALGLPEESDTALTFKDIDSAAWYIPELQTAIEHVVARGFSKDVFAPNAVINREQASKMIGNALRELPKGMIGNVYKDENGISIWARGEVIGLTKESLLQGYPDGTFRPKRNVTRAEAAEMIYNMLQKL